MADEKRIDISAGATGENRSAIVGYTAGVFDLFHVGHLNLLRNARKKCDYLIVGVTVDELAEQVKGVRPFIPLVERMAIVQSVRYVDHVLPQTSMDKLQAWNSLKFDVLFAGDNVCGTGTWNAVEAELAALRVAVCYLPATYVRSEEQGPRGLEVLVVD